jgi:acetoin utilization protein AcuB
MFLVRGAEGVQRALIPGEFRSRRTVEAVIETPKAGEVAGALTAEPESLPGRDALLARYRSNPETPEPTEICFAHEIMTSPVVAIASATSIDNASKIFTEKRFRHIPIVTGSGVVVGLISDRDILLHRATGSPHAAHETPAPVESIMVREVLCASPSARIREVAQVMLDERIGSMPIIDSTELLVGIVTRSDILRAIVRHGPIRLWA